MMTPLLLLGFVLFAFTRLFTVAFAQDTNATCLATNTWATNSRGQNPCLVAAYLQGACSSDGGWTVVSIPDPSLTYIGPEAAQTTVCTCSSIVYSLISACAYCQGAVLPLWNDWSFNCASSEVNNGSYPHTIPSGTAIPAWAYTTIINNTWDSENARSVAAAGFPESSALVPSAVSTTPVSSAPSSSSTTPPSSSTSPVLPVESTTPASSGHSDTGAIVGGAVGGGLGAILLAILAFFLYRFLQKRSPTPVGHHIDSDDKIPGLPHTPNSAAPLMQPHYPMKYYNPEDPSTFPTSPSYPSLPANHGYTMGPPSPPFPQPHSPAGQMPTIPQV